MRISYVDFFQLNKNFTLEDLKQARNKKINSLSKLDIPEHDKKFYGEQIINLYNEAKLDLAQSKTLVSPFGLFNQTFFDDFEKSLSLNFNNTDNFNSYSSASSYQSITNSDGTQTIIQKSKLNKNGKIEEQVNSYKIDSNGNKQPVSYEEALCSFNKNSKVIQKKINYEV